jgi:hypothetical protein
MRLKMDAMNSSARKIVWALVTPRDLIAGMSVNVVVRLLPSRRWTSSIAVIERLKA